MDSSEIPIQSIEDFIVEQMRLGRTPGLAIAIVKKGHTVWEHGFGQADIARSIAMTEHTRVVIGSTTKALTAAAVMQLAEGGKLTLEDPVRKHLPSFTLSDESCGERITVRHVLSHTSGLPPTPSDAPPFVAADAGETKDEYIAELAGVQPLWAPGEGWIYANDGYTIAGSIIERLSGVSYEEYLAARIFEPLRLASAGFPDSKSRPDDVAVPYDYGADGSPFSSFFPFGPASNPGGMCLMSAHDAGRWLATLLNKGTLEGRRVLSEASVAEMLRPQVRLNTVGRLASGEGWYGLGWMSSEIDGLRVLRHGGSAITMGSQFLMVPEQSLAVAVVANSSTDATAVVADGVRDLLSGREPSRTFPQGDPSFKLDRTQWSQLEGIYQATQPQNGITSLLPIEINGSVLQARTYPGGAGYPPGDYLFAPLAESRYLLYGRGKTGGIAEFKIDSDAVRATVQGVPLVKIASHLHKGSVIRWTA